MMVEVRRHSRCQRLQQDVSLQIHFKKGIEKSEWVENGCLNEELRTLRFYFGGQSQLYVSPVSCRPTHLSILNLAS